jgi:hypothetical protein
MRMRRGSKLCTSRISGDRRRIVGFGHAVMVVCGGDDPELRGSSLDSSQMQPELTESRFRKGTRLRSGERKHPLVRTHTPGRADRRAIQLPS